jgi:hypothetical protein
MTRNTTSTRRHFLKGGALFAAPLAVTSATAVLADGTSRERIRRLEDEAAIRTLHHGWLRQVNAGGLDPHLDATVRRIIADHAGAADHIDMAADRRSAVGHFDYAVEFETPLPRDSTLAQMAYVQGHGLMRFTQRRGLTVDYVRADGSWRIAQITLSTV